MKFSILQVTFTLCRKGTLFLGVPAYHVTEIFLILSYVCRALHCVDVAWFIQPISCIKALKLCLVVHN